MASPLTKDQAHARVMQLRDRMFEAYRPRSRAARSSPICGRGSCPKKASRSSTRTGASFVLTINTLALQVYARQIHYLKRNWDLMELFAGKISDEFGYPSPPGHIRVLLTSGHALGLTDDEMLLEPSMPWPAPSPTSTRWWSPTARWATTGLPCSGRRRWAPGASTG